MNLAFPALAIFLLVLPGTLLSYAYRRGFFQRSPVSFSTVSNEVARSVLFALLLHGIGLPVAEGVTQAEVDYEAVLLLLTGDASPNTAEGRAAVRAVARHPGRITVYLLSINLTGLLLGYALHWAVRRTRADLRWDVLRFKNNWHYLFTGEALAFSIPQRERSYAAIREMLAEGVDFVFVSAVVEQAGEASLYWGALSDFYFDAAGRLDRIVLEEAQRRALRADRSAGEAGGIPAEDERFYGIRGNFLVLPYAQIKNLNLEYFTYATEPPAEAEVQKPDASRQSRWTLTWT